MHSARRRGPLRPNELAEAVVLADLSLALTVAGQVLPFGGALLVAAVVPLAIVGARHRLRAVIAGAVAAATVGFLVVGTAALYTMASCAAFGALIGAADRRGWTRARTMVMSVVLLWPPIALISDGLLFAFSDLRELALKNIRNSWRGLFHLLRNIGLNGIASHGQTVVDWVVRNWWASLPLFALGGVGFGTWLAHGLATPALRRVRAAFGDPVVEASVDDDVNAPPAPVPVVFADVAYRYPNAPIDALQDISLRIEPGEFVAIVGPNGSGKSTLARMLAGRRAPTAGTITRPGAIGLGRVGGTAMVFQRPEAQVLGVRVRDDVVWGLARTDDVDVDHALARVGLTELADRETSTLSGGELQRLAIAAAIARHPRMFVSDESTAMVDSEGRAALVALYRQLATDGVTVAHVTHYPSEADAADRTLALGTIHARPNGSPTRLANDFGIPIITLENVGHVYSRGTPWANRALENVNIVIRERESVLVIGHNGSGKSTLAWILAGLTAPSEGSARLRGKPIDAQVGVVGLSFQHARLQLLRPTIESEVSVAAGVEKDAALSSLAAVGLDASFASRRVDELSGGQMRRVVLAEVLARRPRALVLDEPFAGLDADGRADLEQLLTEFRDEHGIALVVVSHDHDLHGALMERVIELNAGRVVRDELVADTVGGSHGPA